MGGAALLLALGLACQGAETPDPRTLVDRLGSPRYAEREEAEQALIRLGSRAYPALQAAVRSSDMEVRARAAAILRKAEGAVLSQPTMVSLDFKDRTVAEVIQSLAERTGMKLSLATGNQTRRSVERITLVEPRPIPYWRALDRLCEEARLIVDPSPRSMDGREQASLTLIDRRGRPITPVSDQGPFRVSLLGLEYRRHVGFAPEPLDGQADAGLPPARPKGPSAPQALRTVVTSNFSVQLQLAAEPRLIVSMAGLPAVTEAVDEKGQSLTMPGRNAVDARPIPSISRGLAPSTIVTAAIQLVRPEEAGKTIKLLRGTIPLVIMARHPDPLVVPLAGAAGKSFDKGDLHVEIHEIRQGPNARGRQIELTAKTAPPPGLMTPAGPGEESAGELQAPQLELVNDRGSPIPWYRTGLDAEEHRVTITLAGVLGGDAKELRYYRVTETRTVVPFEFKDLPMP
ncbi:hypothetical protein [Aquisphaera insulae]|uniref:hypothetical protein n=1 Tax=Aquisphaera insulae TaxID=2712864 RepID=UPI0013EE0558|nr:hypothetical protein [Aquisphaera insulae]